MPVEIKELHIRVTVSGSAPEKSAQNARKDEDHGGPGGDKEEIVAECVEQVLHILQAKKER